MQKLLHSLQRAYDLAIRTMAWLAGAVILATFVAIVFDVAMRNLGFRSPSWTSALSEYAMLVATMAAAPLLIRERGHVWVEIIQAIAGRGVQKVLGSFVVVLCLAVSLIMAWYSAELAFDSAARNEVDIRSIILPRWFLYAVLAVGFTLCAGEFLRFIVGREDMYAKRPDEWGQL